MAMSDPLGRYADPDPQRADGAQERHQRARRRSCARSVLEVLRREGYIRGFERWTRAAASASSRSSSSTTMASR